MKIFDHRIVRMQNRSNFVLVISSTRGGSLGRVVCHVQSKHRVITPWQVEHHVRTKFATPILYAIDNFKNCNFFLHTRNHWEYLLYMILEFLVVFIFCTNYFYFKSATHKLETVCFIKKKQILKFGYYFLLCNKYQVYLLMEKNWIKFWLILVMQLTKNKIVLAARGVQLDNGVTSPWIQGDYCRGYFDDLD